LLADLGYVMAHPAMVAGVTVAVLLGKTLLGWGLLYGCGVPVGRALVPSLITPQIGEFSFILVASGVASGIFVGGEVDFLFAVIAASLFLSPIWSGFCIICWCVIESMIHTADHLSNQRPTSQPASPKVSSCHKVSSYPKVKKAAHAGRPWHLSMKWASILPGAIRLAGCQHDIGYISQRWRG
jgi:Kef-type K+ transport system membrane component KefB